MSGIQCYTPSAEEREQRKREIESDLAKRRRADMRSLLAGLGLGAAVLGYCLATRWELVSAFFAEHGEPLVVVVSGITACALIFKGLIDGI
jgi:hypothetical protein